MNIKLKASSRTGGPIAISIILMLGLHSGCADGQPARMTIVDEKATTSACEVAVPHVSWVDVETGGLIFSSRDIVRFDWDRQRFELTRDRAIDLLSMPPQLKREFIVRDRSGDEIYRGCFMSPISSMGYDGPTICIDSMSGIKPPLYQIDGGYPGDMGRGQVRFDPRLRQALQEAGVLDRIEDREGIDPVQTQFSGWSDGRQGVKIAVMLFPETFRVGSDARFVLRITGARHLKLEADEWEATVKLASDGGRMEAVDCLVIPPDVVDQRPWGAWVYRGRLSAVSDAKAKLMAAAGPAELNVIVVARKRTDGEPRTVGSWSISPQKIEIQPANP